MDIYRACRGRQRDSCNWGTSEPTARISDEGATFPGGGGVDGVSLPPNPQQRLPTPLVRLSDCKDWIF